MSVRVQSLIRADVGSSGTAAVSTSGDIVTVSGIHGLVDASNDWRDVCDVWTVSPSAIAAGGSDIVSTRIGSKPFTRIFDSAGETLLTPTPVEKCGAGCLSEDDVIQLALWAALVETHYEDRRRHTEPIEIQWAKDGVTGKLFVLNARRIGAAHDGVVQAPH